MQISILSFFNHYRPRAPNTPLEDHPEKNTDLQVPVINFLTRQSQLTFITWYCFHDEVVK